MGMSDLDDGGNGCIQVLFKSSEGMTKTNDTGFSHGGGFQPATFILKTRCGAIKVLREYIFFAMS